MVTWILSFQLHKLLQQVVQQGNTVQGPVPEQKALLISRCCAARFDHKRCSVGNKVSLVSGVLSGALLITLSTVTLQVDLCSVRV